MTKICTDPLHRRLWLRRRFSKRIIVFALLILAAFYLPVLIFGSLKVPQILRLTNLNRCPACYGISICPELYSSQISLREHGWREYFFNVKNIYHGYTKSNRNVILKKLAYDAQFNEFDDNLCKSFNLNKDCKPLDLMNISGLDKKIKDLVYFNFTSIHLHPRTGITFCPYPDGIYDFIKPVMGNRMGKTLQTDYINIWTMLTLNAEPIVLQNLPKSKGWRVPAYAGVCGRIEVVAYEGVPLHDLWDIPWNRKLYIAKEILEMAMDFTFKHDRYRFYFFDWSVDNIAVNEKDQVSYVDLEDVVILDKHITPREDLPNWHQRYLKENYDHGYMFSINSLCKHHLSDHNIYSACYVLIGDDRPFLKDIPKHLQSGPFMDLLEQCYRGPDRFKAASLLKTYIGDLLSQDSVGHSVR